MLGFGKTSSQPTFYHPMLLDIVTPHKANTIANIISIIRLIIYPITNARLNIACMRPNNAATPPAKLWA